MDEIRNPYVPGAGTQPPELTGREELLHRANITLARAKLGKQPKSFIAVGLRGVGKTVLLNRIRDMAEKAEYKICYVEAHEQKTLPEMLTPALRSMLLDLDRLGSLSEKVKIGLRTLRSFISAAKVTVNDIEFGLDINPEIGRADSGDLEADLPDLLLAIARAAQDRNTAVVIILDELQYLKTKEFSALIMGIHRVSQENLPLLLIGAGLPQIVGLAGTSKSYAERLFDYPQVGKLSAEDAANALALPAQANGASYTPDALKELISITQGYPYFLQEWGYHVWNIAPENLITLDDVKRANVIVIQRLDESFFRVRLDRLTNRERDYLRAMAQLGPGPHRSGDIAEALGIRVQTCGPLRTSLARKGMIFSPQHGETAFTVPLFDQYMRRAIPNPIYK
jgi:DNA-binding CsgD family transcriptional regulator